MKPGEEYFTTKWKYIQINTLFDLFFLGCAWEWWAHSYIDVQMVQLRRLPPEPATKVALHVRAHVTRNIKREANPKKNGKKFLLPWQP